MTVLASTAETFTFAPFNFGAEVLVFSRLFSAHVLQSKGGENSLLNGYGEIKSAQIVMKIRIHSYFGIVSSKIIIVEFFLHVPAPSPPTPRFL